MIRRMRPDDLTPHAPSLLEGDVGPRRKEVVTSGQTQAEFVHLGLRVACGALSPKPQGLRGIFGQPYINLERYLDTTSFPQLHEEVCLALAQIPVAYTGGSHRSMQIMPEGREHEAHGDYGEVIRAMTSEQFEVFRRLADDPSAIGPDARSSFEFGEERAISLSRRQMLWLEVRFGVYFPWKFYVELIPNRYWGDKSSAEGKTFTRIARTFFPKTIEFVQSLPFQQIGRCNIMGLQSFDHGTVHRDGDPDEQDEPDHFITFVPGGDKRLFLWDPVERREIFVDGRVYWFNDFDYHGVGAAPDFRYSIRVDGIFHDDFLERLQVDVKAGG
jgi:hypothetical protein